MTDDNTVNVLSAGVFRVTLVEGDVLFIPEGWWHAVEVFTNPIYCNVKIEPMFFIVGAVFLRSKLLVPKPMQFICFRWSSKAHGVLFNEGRFTLTYSARHFV